MKVEAYTCDRCASKHVGRPPLELTWYGPRAERHLCPRCVVALRQWIDKDEEEN